MRGPADPSQPRQTDECDCGYPAWLVLSAPHGKAVRSARPIPRPRRAGRTAQPYTIPARAPSRPPLRLHEWPSYFAAATSSDSTFFRFTSRQVTVASQTVTPSTVILPSIFTAVVRQTMTL